MKKTTELNPYGWNRITDHAALWGVTKGRISHLVKEGRLETNGKTGKKLRVRGYLANWKPAGVDETSRPQVGRAGLGATAHNTQAQGPTRRRAQVARTSNKVSETPIEKTEPEKRAEKVQEKKTAPKQAVKVSTPPEPPEMWMTYEEARAEKMKQDARLAKLKVQEKDFAFRANYCNKIASAFVRAFVPLKQHLIELDLNKKQIAVLSALVDGCLMEFEKEVQKEINGDSAESEDEE